MSDTRNDMRVTFFQRKAGNVNFSIETLFHSIITALPAEVTPTLSIATHVNSGIWSKLYNTFEILFKKQGDINHITGDVHYIALFLKKRKTILTIHDVNLMYSSSPIKRAIHRWFWLRIPIMRSGAVTVISETTKAELLKYANCSADKIRVIHNCISPSFRPHPKAFNKIKPTLLQIGCKPNKNLKGIIEAIKDIECRLEIVGKPADEEIALLKKYKIDYNYQAGLTEAEVIQKYIDCDIVVFASFFEGFGLPIIEANTMERAVITSNVSAMPEIAGNAACLVNPECPDSIRNGLLKVIEDDAYRDELIANGRLNRARFTTEAIAGQYYALYREMMSGSENVPSKIKAAKLANAHT